MPAEISVTIEVRAGYEKVARASIERDIVGVPAEAMYRDLEPAHFQILEDALAPQVQEALRDVAQQVTLRKAEAADRAQERAL